MSNPVHILLVDDHEDTNRSLTLLLGRRGYRVRSAGSVAAALEWADRETFDLLISDLSLPDGNGLELLERLETKPRFGGIIVSGFREVEDVERSRAAGYSEHLVKPVDIQHLDAVIRRMTGQAPPAP